MITKYHKKIASYAIYNQLLASECFIQDKKKLNLTVEWGIRLYDLLSLPKVLMRDYRLLTITKLEQPSLQIDPNTGNYFTTPLFLYRLLNYAITKVSLFLVDTNDVESWKILDKNILKNDEFNVGSYNVEVGLSKISIFRGLNNILEA